jgi:hypothetical protein
MNPVAELAKNLAEEAAKSGNVQLGIVMLQDQDGNMHKTEFGFGADPVQSVVISDAVVEKNDEPPQEPEKPDAVDVRTTDA